MNRVQREFTELLNSNVDFFGFVNVRDYCSAARNEENWIDPFDLIAEPKTIVVIGVKTVDELLKRPGKNVAWHNITINIRLNQVLYDLSRFLNKKGFQVFPHFTINQNYTPPKWQDIARDVMPSKIIAKIAGIGSIGRNNLFIHKEFGAGVRLTALTTSAEFNWVHKVYENLCNSCGLCINMCPAGALTEKGYDPERCWQFLYKLQKTWGYAGCGNCMLACRRNRKNNSQHL
ncbi:MAG: epoxyqueuosine reductase [Firmicutes bacterium]|nr:epoxyqueuosine reductase [Bacillota bacterium]